MNIFLCKVFQWVYDGLNRSKTMKAKKWSRLVEARKMWGYTQKDMAMMCDVAPSTYIRWENLQFEPSLSQIKTMSFYLDVPLDFLLGNTTFDNHSTMEYWMNVHYAKQEIANGLANPDTFLFKNIGILNGKSLADWAADKLGLPDGYFLVSDLQSVFPDELRLEAAEDVEEAGSYFEVIPGKDDFGKAKKGPKKR